MATTAQPEEKKVRRKRGAKNLYLDPVLVDATETVLAEKEPGKSLSTQVEEWMVARLKRAGKLPAGY